MTPMGWSGFLLRSAGTQPRPFSTVISMEMRPPLSSVQMYRSGLRISTSDGCSMAAAVTSPSPSTSRRMVTGPSECSFSSSRFRFKMMSVVSSTTPGMVENSCSTPSMRTDVTAAPGSDDSKIRRSELPNVIP